MEDRLLCDMSSDVLLQRLQRAPHYSMLGTPDELEWKSYRKTLSLAFSPENMRKVNYSHKSYTFAQAVLIPLHLHLSGEKRKETLLGVLQQELLINTG